MDIEADISVFRDNRGRLRAIIESGHLGPLLRQGNYLEILSGVLGVRLCLPPAEEEITDRRLVVVEAEPLVASVGIAGMKKKGEPVSGDRGTYFKTDQGILCVILADGMPMAAAASLGDIFVTVTGCRDVITAEHFPSIKDGAILCNAGHFNVEVNLDQLAELSARRYEARQNIEGYVMPDGRTLFVLAEGRLVNLASGDGHPAEIMREFVVKAKEKADSQKEYFALNGFSGRDDLIYITCIPWISFTSISHTISLDKDDAVPRISWGKYYREGEKTLLPFSLQVSHIFVDGLHLARYFGELQKFMDSL